MKKLDQAAKELKESIDMTTVSKGIYFLKLIDEDFKTYTQKIIVE